MSAAEYKVKYADSALGYVWTLAKPLAWFTVLYFVFGRFFRLEGGIQHYAVYLLLGIVTWTFFLDATKSGLESFVSRGAVLRKMSLPRIVIPLSTTVTSSLTLAVNAFAVAIFIAVDRLRPEPRWLLIVFPLLEIVVFTVLVAVVLATLYVRARDIGPLWDLSTQLLFFASPIFYPVGFLPGWGQKIAFADPYVQALQDMRAFIVPQKELVTTSDIYGGSWGYVFPLGFLVCLAVGTVILFRKRAPYLAELA